MDPMYLVLLLLAGALAVAAWVRFDTDPTADRSDDSVWDGARRDLDGPLDAGIFRIARPLAQTRAVRQAADTSRNPALRAVRDKLTVSGCYGASVEVFLSAQVASLLVATGLLMVIVGLELSGLMKLILVGVAVAIAFQPYQRVSSAANKRQTLTNEALPEFSSLLLMPLASGMSVESALRFTVRFTSGPVTDATRWLLDVLASRSMPDDEAFQKAGARLGTPEAAAFFAALAQAHIEGTRISDTLSKQNEALRIQSHQARRAKIKRIPVKMIAAFAVHFLPLLFVMAILPLMVGLKTLS